ncbi:MULTISPECIES: hypothetical protein [unclassified Streptomyces]|uniref:Uncharacterized protein n=1 Tax=Streptomyces sp. NBC_00060 TaxID=2975636 RepID=A0AAU2HA33_9ACTN
MLPRPGFPARPVGPSRSWRLSRWALRLLLLLLLLPRVAPVTVPRVLMRGAV